MFKKHYFSLGALSPHRWLTSVASIFFLVSWLWAGQAQAQVPTITSFSPLSAKPADAVTITGTNFNTTAANNIVFFGATKANVTAATATSLTVTVPTGATYAPITVLNTGTTLAAYSKANFNPIYSPAKTAITTSDFLPKEDFATGTGPFSVAIGDLDGDGKPDLAVANVGLNTVSVLRNTSTSGSIGSGSFAAKEDFATGTSPRSVAIGDLDGDGKPDLATANFGSNKVSVLRNTSTSGSITSGSFAAKVDFATGRGPNSVAIGDLDGDGKPDLAVANYEIGVNTVSVLRNTSTSGSTSFAAKEDFATGTGPYSVAIGDLDGDGKPDLAVGNAGTDDNTVSVLRNTSTSGSIGSGSFAAKVNFATGTGPTSVAIGDLDGDGKPDLATANYNSATVSVLRNTSTSGSIGSGSFAAKEDFATGASSRSVAIGDLDGDGKPDLAVANYDANTVSVLRNTSTIGSTSFAAKEDFGTRRGPSSVAIGDLDGDGKPDLAVANYGTGVNTVSVLRNADIVPTITSFSPLSAKPADAVTITGTNFNTTAANNIVFFGATKANVTAATATSLTVTVPTGATYAPITVLNTGTTLAAYSKANFNPIYSPAKTAITTSDFSPKQDFATGTAPFSVAIGDLDGDGKPDLAVANYGTGVNTVSVLRNTSTSGSTSFATKVDFATGTRPSSVAIGDLDGDGKPDLAVAYDLGNTVSVLRNTSTSGSIGSGSFAAKVDFATGTYPNSVAIGDLDGDGKPDLATANYEANTVSVLRNTSTSGSTSFAAKEDFATGTGPYSVAIGDLDGDGKPDLAVANYDIVVNTVSVLRNTSTSGSTSFATKVDFATGTSPSSVAIGDLDGDGKPDLAVANYDDNTVSVLRNTTTNGSIGSGSFAAKQDFATRTGPRSVAIGDLDGDGKPDLAVANLGSNRVSVLRNTSTSGSTSFAAKVDFATGALPYSVAIGDLDGDGKPDLATANYNANRVSVLRNADIANPAPTITSFSPLSGKPADAVTITGTNFNTTAANNIVFFGATKANVTAATATSLTVTVPTGATYAPITVLNTGTTLAAYSKANFNPIYSPAKTAITTSDFSPKQDFTTGTRPFSVAIGDLDGDGKPDLAVANNDANTVSVLRNTSTSGSIGSGSFAVKVDFGTGAGPISVAIGDLDGDGKPDLAVANFGTGVNTVSVLRNTSTSGSIGSGSFAAKVDFGTGAGPISVAIGDLDGDGKPDLAVANYEANTVSVLRNTSTSGSTSFATKVDFGTGTGPISVAIGDLDGDGKPDLAVANYDDNKVSVLRNTSTSGSIGSGSFAAKVDFATGAGPNSVAIGDLDGDGKPDLAVANIEAGVNTVSVLRNTSTSGSIVSDSFAAKVDFGTGAGPISVAIGDLDGDGKPDLAVANYGTGVNTVSVLRNTSTSGSITSGSFAAKEDFATGTGPSSVAIGDLDGDGKPDLATANYNSNRVSVLRNADIATPTITTTGTLTAFTACAGTASAQQSFTVSGSNLTNNITVTAPAGFEISTVNNSGFATTPITLTQSGGNVSITTIYVRMAATATGTPSGNVTCASSGATDKTVAVSGTANTNPSVVINKSSSSICVGATLTLTASAPLPELAGLAPDIAPVSSDGYAWASSGGTFVSSTGSPGSTGSPISWSSGSSGGVTFTVTATNSNNCSATATATVRVNENPSVSISPLPSSICIGATIELTALSGVDGSAGLSPNINSVSGDDYTWASSGGTFVSNTGSPVSWSSSGAGGFNFTVTATNTNSCSATATASVTVGNGSITAMPPTSICAGATINLTASGGISYSWVHSGGGSFSSSTNPVTFNSSSAGGFGFTVTATVTGGCTATATTSVSVKANPSVVITPSATSVCVGKSINLNASTPLPQSAGLAPFVPLPSDGYAWASSGGTFVSSTGSPGSTGSPISWSSGSSGGVTFTVTATNSNNCSATATATVLVNENPTVSINPPTSSICTGQTLELRASPNADQAGLSPSITPVSSDSYAWASSGGTFNSSAATATFSSSSAGGFSFTVTATNSNSCSATATASVTVGNASITAMPPTSICAGATINLTASGGISYSWVHSGGGSFSSSTNPVTFSSSSAGGFGFTVTATVSGGCTATATTSVSVKANPTVSINPATSSICVGKTLNLIASTSPPPSAGLAPGVTILPSDGYAWASSGGGTFISSTNQATFSSSSAGGFGFTVTATNANSCSATATASVTVNANPSVSISPGTSSLCTGQTLELRAGPPNPSSAGLSGVSVSSDSYTWASSGGNFVSSTNPATFSSNIAGGFRFTVTASNSNSCSATATASATVNTKPALSISQSNNQVCAGVSINLTATSGLSNYSWVHSGGTFTSTTNEARFSSGAGGTFTFTVTAGNSSCSNSATTTVLVYGVSSANLSFAPICALGNPLNLSASGGGSYSWRGPNGFKSSSATPSKAKTVAKDEGIYSVTVSSTLGCTSTSTIKVYVGVGKITATSNSTVCKGGTIQLSATAEFGASYKWTKQFSSVTYQGQNPTIPNAQPSNGGVYLVFVTGVNGCVVKEEVLVVVSSRACTSGRLASGEEVEGMEMEVNTYPNPTSKLLTVEVKLAKPSSLNLQLFNATGNTLTEWNLSEESTIHRKEIDLSIYKDGLYLIQAQSKDGKQTKRVMKIE